MHSYDLDYGRQAGGPETDYSGRAGYPVPEPRWEPPARGPYTPRLRERGFREPGFADYGFGERELEARGFDERDFREWDVDERGFDERRRPRAPYRQRPMRRPPRHWSAKERPGRRRR